MGQLKFSLWVARFISQCVINKVTIANLHKVVQLL